MNRLLFALMGKFEWSRNIRWKMGFSNFVSGIGKRHGSDFRITKVWLDESRNECDMCGACEFSAPGVFQVPEKMVIIPEVDLRKNRDQILEGVYVCPVGVIAVEINGIEKINWAE